MQISSSNGSLQNRYFSGTGSIGGIHLPDFHDTYVFSRKQSGTSEEEYRRQIRKQAYEDFEKGQFQNKSEGFNRLMKSYTSEVSPDRKGIVNAYHRRPVLALQQPDKLEFYFLLLVFFTVENAKTGSETKSIIPNVLTIISGNSIAKILAPTKKIVAIPITIKLIDHIVLIIFKFIFLPP